MIIYVSFLRDSFINKQINICNRQNLMHQPDNNKIKLNNIKHEHLCVSSTQLSSLSVNKRINILRDHLNLVHIYTK